MMKRAVQLDRFTLDLCLMRIEGTTESHKWMIVQLDSPSQHPFSGGSEPAKSIRERVADLEALRRWAPRNLATARAALADFTPQFHGYVIAGRRSMLAPKDRELVGSYNKELFGVTLRTYDWLVETSVSMS